MKYLGIDYGSKKVGVAVSDADGKIAFPRAIFNNDADLVKEIRILIEKEHIGHVVVGDTRTVGGEANEVTEKLSHFVRQIEKIPGIFVEMIFEAWSSAEAARYAPPRKGHDDASAAAIILQRYIDIHRSDVSSE